MRYEFGHHALDTDRFVLSGPNGPIHIEPQVFAVLHHLILHRDRVVSREELLDSIWGDRFVSLSALTSRVKAARRAVGDDGNVQRVIRTAHGRGYQFVADLVADGYGGRRSLPRPRNRLLGRDGEVASIARDVRERPLVTITGAGGIGKTAVALAVAQQLQPEIVGGAVFVDLSPVPPGGPVVRAVADAAGVEGVASETVAALAEHLAHRTMLLVLDNCEHVLAPVAALVDRMLTCADTAHILTTSRAPLGVAGEQLWPLGPLHGAAPHLFVERARSAEPRLEWDPSDPAVVEICRRLDDLPLALELAAGQLRRFELEELRRRLDDRLGLISGHAGGDAHRHTTMETAVDWSYRLLDRAEQRLLRELSVFPASFDVHAVEACAPVSSGASLVDVFGGLVDMSLVVREPGSGRYRLLETIRVFARDRLDEAGEAATAFERHRRRVSDRAAATSRLDRWFSARLAAVFRAEIDDARQAFRLGLDAGEVDDAVDLAVGASFLWRNAVGCAEGDAWIDALVATELSPRDELWVHVLRSDVGQGRGDHRQMLAAAAAAGSSAAAAGDVAAACLVAHYEALAHLTDVERAAAALGQALDLAHRAGDRRLVTLVEAFAGVGALAAGGVEDARRALSVLDRHASEEGYDRFIVHWANWMGALADGDGPGARRWFDRQQVFLDRTGIVETWITRLSATMCDAADGVDVRPGLTRTLALADQEGYDAAPDCVLVLAYAAVCEGRPDLGAELIGTATHGRFNATAHYALYRAVLDPLLRGRLDADERAAAAARGRSTTAHQVLAHGGVERPGAVVDAVENPPVGTRPTRRAGAT